VELSEVETVEHVPVLRVAGDVDLATSGDLRATLTELVERGTRLMVIDISRVDFFDSSGLKVLDDVQRAVRARGGDIALVCPQERLLRLFRITGLADRFAIGATTENAVMATPGRRADSD
jgi:anti-sigma B factor antagonist